MAQLTTRHALNRLLNSEDYELLWLKSGYTKAYRSQCRHRLKNGELSAAVQDAILTKCGFQVVVEKQWGTPDLPRFW